MGKRIKKQQSHVRFCWLLVALLLLIFLRYTLQIDVPRVLSLGVICLIALYGTQTEVIAMMLCLVPMHEVVDFYYSMTAVLGIYVLKFYRRIRINLSIILVLAMAFWELLHSLSSDMEPVSLLSAFIPMALLALLMSSDIREIDYTFVVNVFAVSTIFICITMIGQVLAWSDFNVVLALENLRRLGVVSEAGSKAAITGGTIQTNSLGVICVLAISGLLQLRSAGLHNKWTMPMVVAMLALGALTSSRTFVACLLIMAFLLFCGYPGGITKKIQFFGGVLLTVAVALLLLYTVVPDLLEYFVGRFFVADITTGRDDLMINYHNFIMDNHWVLFFGTGIQNYGDKLVVVHRVAGNVPHNSIQEIIVAWGLPGLILFSILCLMPILQARKYNGRMRVLNYIPLVIILAKSMVGQLLTSGYSLLALSYAYLSLAQDFTGRDTQKS